MISLLLMPGRSAWLFRAHTNRRQRAQKHFTTAGSLLLESITITSYNPPHHHPAPSANYLKW